MNQSSDTNHAIRRLESRLTEAFDALWDDYVDPRQAFAGEGSDWWTPIGSGGAGASASVTAPHLEQLRDECRRLSMTNEFAINGHENRISYIVGPGHNYLATVAKGRDASPDLALRVQAVVEEFLAENRWHDRQQEIVRRLDRDGEVFLRMFPDDRGLTRVRFIEPEQVAPPKGSPPDTAIGQGIVTEDHDVESALGYYVDGRLVDASEIQHRKANVDRNVKRGLPLYTPVRANLRRA